MVRLATIGLHVFYFNLLPRAYDQGDLSLVYPVARGMGPMLVPILAVILLDEIVGPLAIIWETPPLLRYIHNLVVG
ncbi:MAG: hypothetical protein CM1200mP22_05230 [Dehalococcoidia bacterium]|nr:MAG: hypothetical protein CM1200mP22_05230 [Dehalococcoidia bacterium]